METLELDLRHYETIVAIVELGTMTEAAKALYSTQSTLSHRVAEAERRLGVRLFDRGRHRRLTPTRAGLATHQAASRALDELARNEQILLTERSQVTSIVRIGVGSYDCFHWYPSFLAAAHRAHPDVEIELVVVGEAPGEMVVAADVDLVIAPGTPAGPVERIPAFTDELVLVTAPGHPLAERDFIEPIDLVGDTYLTYNSNPTPGFEYDRFIRAGDDYPRVVSVVPQTSAITELVAAGAGVSILSRWALHPAISTGRVASTRCGPDGLDLTWSLLARPGDADESPTLRIGRLLASHLRTTPT